MDSMLGDVGQGASLGAMGGPWGAAIGGGLGLANYALFQRPAYQKQLQLAAATQRYSPWTHLQAQAPDSPSPLAAGLGMASAGASLGQNMDKASQNSAMNNAYLDYLKNYSPQNFEVAAGQPQSSPTPPLSGLNTPPYQPGMALPPGYNPWYGQGG